MSCVLRLLKVFSVAIDIVLPESTIALIGLPLRVVLSSGNGEGCPLLPPVKAFASGWRSCSWLRCLAVFRVMSHAMNWNSVEFVKTSVFLDRFGWDYCHGLNERKNNDWTDCRT